MSYITCPAEKVIEAANAAIDRIMAKRNARDEKAIQRRIDYVTSKKHFWSRKPKTCTREDAIKWLERNSDFFGWRSIYAWGDLEKVKDLLILAKHGDPVVIDTEAARVLWGHEE